MFNQTGYPYNLLSCPTNYTVSVSESGGMYDNTGAAGMVIFTLPPANPGLQFTFASSVIGKQVQLKASGSDVIKFAGLASVTASTSSATNFGCATLTCISSGVWQVTSFVGTWT